MDSSPPPSLTIDGADVTGSFLDPVELRPVFVLPTHLTNEELHELEDACLELGAALTYDIVEAGIIVTKVEKKRRLEMELRNRRLWLEHTDSTVSDLSTPQESCEPLPKKRRIQQCDESSEVGQTLGSELQDIRSPEAGHIKVVTLLWLQDSQVLQQILPLRKYLVFEGKTVPYSHGLHTPSTPSLLSGAYSSPRPERPPPVGMLASSPSILERAQADSASAPRAWRSSPIPSSRHGRLSRQAVRPKFDRQREPGVGRTTHMNRLLLETTSEYEGLESETPEAPEWVKKNIIYSCQRLTPPNPPNDLFIAELKKIRLARTLINDEVGVRAYSSSIAAIAAYPYPISAAREVIQIPGCDVKIANLWVEWKNNGGVIQAVVESDSDPDLSVLRIFYNIWGVGALTAREFYHDKGWRDLDDIIEFGWKTLTRVQQIGVKYYDEFLEKIPRTEVEDIAAIVHKHAIKVRDHRIETVITGGYRRGKLESGDVDLIISHPDLDSTANLITDIVSSLEEEGWVTHTLLLSLHNTNRGQATLPHRTGGGGHGFDTLDKALVVWQDPDWPTKQTDLATDSEAKNPNIHRRVDIIISPWRTRGCAIAGWTSGTTFQRDLRRYARKVKGWKFDSSGVRDRQTGEVILLEGPDGTIGTPEEAERRVLEGMGLEYIEPEQRCTG